MSASRYKRLNAARRRSVPRFCSLVADSRDPFRTLRLPYTAGPTDVRQAFRRLAWEVHPDRGGSARDFHDVRVAYGALTQDLEGARRLWRPPPEAAHSRYAAGLDPSEYPTCPIRVTSERGRRTVAYDVGARPPEWTPTRTPPPGGTCVARAEATEDTPAFGVWTVPLDDHRFRCVFGPPPADT
ncbi:J domain-containing protein [Rubricoccus marinus]|uniref:J domain-containing protein n=1 Tax=Rubricoccus marinus TaxID=716817 RepID=UPI001C530A4D|nr:J domain-containing protein [Rubricoccus marinus]